MISRSKTARCKTSQAVKKSTQGIETLSPCPDSPSSQPSIVELLPSSEVNLQETVLSLKDMFVQFMGATEETQKNLINQVAVLQESLQKITEAYATVSQKLVEQTLQNQELKEQISILCTSTLEKQAMVADTPVEMNSPQPLQSEAMNSQRVSSSPQRLSPPSSQSVQDLLPPLAPSRGATYSQVVSGPPKLPLSPSSQPLQALPPPPISIRQRKQLFAQKLQSVIANPSSNPQTILGVLLRKPISPEEKVQKVSSMVVQLDLSGEALQTPYLSWQSAIRAITGEKPLLISLLHPRLAEIFYDSKLHENFQKLLERGKLSSPFKLNPEKDIGRRAVAYRKCRFPELRHACLQGFSATEVLQVIDRAKTAIEKEDIPQPLKQLWRHIIKEDQKFFNLLQPQPQLNVQPVPQPQENAQIM